MSALDLQAAVETAQLVFGAIVFACGFGVCMWALSPQEGEGAQ